MKRLGCMFLAVILCLTLVITPAMAKGGGGNSGNVGKNNSGAKSTDNSQKQSLSSGNVKDTDSNKAPGKTKANTQIQGTKSIGVSSGKKVQDVIDLTRGNKEAVQERIKAKEKTTVQKQFNDTNTHWAQNKIQEIQKLGLIQGYEDGSFKPEAPVSMAEAMVMAVNLAEIVNDNNNSTGIDNGDASQNTDETTGDTTIDATTDDTTTNDETMDDTLTNDNTNDENSEDEGNVDGEDEDVSDVPAWARNQARMASGMGIININRFHSEVQASRAQTAVMLAKALELEPTEVDENAFTDTLKISAEDIGYILALKQAGIISGTPDGKFNPNSAITRAEIATMLANIVGNVEDEEDGEEQSEEEITTPDTDTDTEDGEGADATETDTLNDETQPGTDDTETKTEDATTSAIS